VRRTVAVYTLSVNKLKIYSEWNNIFLKFIPHEVGVHHNKNTLLKNACTSAQSLPHPWLNKTRCFFRRHMQSASVQLVVSRNEIQRLALVGDVTALGRTGLRRVQSVRYK
jgi:hypothetical protein